MGRAVEVAYADETSWKLWGKLCWLWAAATASIAVLVIYAKPSALGFVAHLGAEFDGLLHSDRYHVYLQVPAARRQICWAHLKRDFRKVVDDGGDSLCVGRRGAAFRQRGRCRVARVSRGQRTPVPTADGRRWPSTYRGIQIAHHAAFI